MSGKEIVRVEKGICIVTARRRVMDRTRVMALATLLFPPICFVVFILAFSRFDLGRIGANELTVWVSIGALIVAMLAALSVAMLAFADLGRLVHQTILLDVDGVKVDGRMVCKLSPDASIFVSELGIADALRAKAFDAPMLWLWLPLRALLERVKLRNLAREVPASVWCVRAGVCTLPVPFLDRSAADELARCLSAQLDRHHGRAATDGAQRVLEPVDSSDADLTIPRVPNFG
ncbi:hypothetical protein [Henriciella litoralis]|uniref:hypothetical protein n=1 Tax=Henriciella litoralis TaxID=568102 RepID=UPI000A05FFA4|nr:hypothetical protein [Henriciella litoralis]